MRGLGIVLLVVAAAAILTYVGLCVVHGGPVHSLSLTQQPLN